MSVLDDFERTITVKAMAVRNGDIISTGIVYNPRKVKKVEYPDKFGTLKFHFTDGTKSKIIGRDSLVSVHYPKLKNSGKSKLVKSATGWIKAKAIKVANGRLYIKT